MPGADGRSTTPGGEAERAPPATRGARDAPANPAADPRSSAGGAADAALPENPSAGAGPGGTQDVWVDQTASGRSGDGSESAPFATLAEALQHLGPACGAIHFHAGRYQGGAELTGACTLTGPATARLIPGRDGVVLLSAGPLVIEGLTFEGGDRALELSAPARIDGATFLHQREVTIHTTSTLEVHRGRFEADQAYSAVSIDGAQATLMVAESSFAGHYRRTLDAREAALVRIDRSTFSGASSAIHQNGGHLELHEVTLSGGPDAAIALSRVTGSLDGVEVRGHEYALLARIGDGLRVTGLLSEDATRAAIGLSGGDTTLTHVVVRRPGALGALQAIGGKVLVESMDVEDAREQAVMAHDAQLVLRDLTVDRVGGGDHAGDAVQIWGGKARIERLRVANAAGSCLLAGSAAAVIADELQLTSCGVFGIELDTLATFRGTRLHVAQCAGTAVSAGGGATGTLEGLVAKENREGPAKADCLKGTKLRLIRLTTDTALAPSECIQSE